LPARLPEPHYHIALTTMIIVVALASCNLR
jgi:hypothetical protein